MDAETIELLLANRNFLYSLAARGYAEEPDAALLDILQQDHTHYEIELVQDSSAEVIKSFEEVLAFLDSGQNLGALRSLYTRVFVGPGTLFANPWESVHVTGKRVLFQREMLSVRECYRMAGFMPQRYPTVADDFIGLELDFLSKLASASVEANAAGDNVLRIRRLQQSKTFLDEHLLRWIDSLGVSIEQGYGACLFSAFTRFVSAVAKRDSIVLEELLNCVANKE